MTDINHALQELNILSSKESKNSIDKLIDLIEIDQKTSKFFNSKTVFASFILSVVSISIIFEKIIEFLIKAFKIMHFNSARAVIANEMQRIVNVILYQQLIILSVNASVDFEQMSIQVAQINIFDSENYYDNVKSEHKINDCSKVNQFMNSGLIYFNERRRMYFD